MNYLTDFVQVNDYGDQALVTPLYPCYRCPRILSLHFPGLIPTYPTMRPAVKESTLANDRVLGPTQTFELSCGHTYAAVGPEDFDLGVEFVLRYDRPKIPDARLIFRNGLGIPRIQAGPFDPVGECVNHILENLYFEWPNIDKVALVRGLLDRLAVDQGGRAGVDEYWLKDKDGTVYAFTMAPDDNWYQD